MKTAITISTNGNSWEIVPASTVAGVVFGVLFTYLFFRHVMFILMFMDLMLGWLRKFKWFPKEGKRYKTFIHWVIALVLFLGFSLWLVPQGGWNSFLNSGHLSGAQHL